MKSWWCFAKPASRSEWSHAQDFGSAEKLIPKYKNVQLISNILIFLVGLYNLICKDHFILSLKLHVRLRYRTRLSLSKTFNFCSLFANHGVSFRLQQFSLKSLQAFHFQIKNTFTCCCPAQSPLTHSLLSLMTLNEMWRLFSMMILYSSAPSSTTWRKARSDGAPDKTAVRQAGSPRIKWNVFDGSN